MAGNSVCLRTVLMKKIFLASVICLMAMAPLGAQKPDPSAAKLSAPAANSLPTTVPNELTAPDVQVFLDGLIPTLLEHNDVAGAVVMIVKDGKVLYSHGYGYSDVKSKKPVSADDTLFQPG